jgi:hypothetical protein
MPGSGESSPSEGRDEFGFDLAAGDDEELELGEDEEDLDDEDLEDEDEDGLLDEDELIDLDDEYDDADQDDKQHPGHRYDD